MTDHQTRRTVLKQGGAAAAVALAGPALGRPRRAEPLFRISLAQWSFHRAIGAGEMDHLDFARVARREFGVRSATEGAPAACSLEEGARASIVGILANQAVVSDQPVAIPPFG